MSLNRTVPGYCLRLAALTLVLVELPPAASRAPEMRAVPETTLPLCPVQITTVQSLRDAVPGWTPQREARGNPSNEVGFYIGNVQEMAQLAPDWGSRNVNGFNVDPYVDPTGVVHTARLACGYEHTDTMLTHELPTSIRKCSIRTLKSRRPADDYVVKCR
jgi:hypothetical protein